MFVIYQGSQLGKFQFILGKEGNNQLGPDHTYIVRAQFLNGHYLTMQLPPQSDKTPWRICAITDHDSAFLNKNLVSIRVYKKK